MQCDESFDGTRPAVLTFQCPRALARLLTLFKTVAQYGTKEHGCWLHCHHFEERGTVHSDALGDKPSAFAPSGKHHCAAGLFLSLQCGNNKVVVFFCTTAKVEYNADCKIVESICMQYEPFLIEQIYEQIKEHDFGQDFSMETTFYMALQGHSMATNAAFYLKEPHALLDMFNSGLDTPQAKTMANKPLAAQAYVCVMFQVLAHLAIYEDSLHHVRNGPKTQAYLAWLLKMYPCDKRDSFWLRRDIQSGLHKLLDTLLYLNVRPYDFNYPFNAVAGLAEGALKMRHFPEPPPIWHVKAMLATYLDRLTLAPLEDVFPSLLALPPPVLSGALLTPPPMIPHSVAMSALGADTSAGEIFPLGAPPPSPPGNPDGEVTVSEADSEADSSSEDLPIMDKKTKRKLLGEFKAAKSAKAAE